LRKNILFPTNASPSTISSNLDILLAVSANFFLSNIALSSIDTPPQGIAYQKQKIAES
jgi:hypothetical protein